MARGKKAVRKPASDSSTVARQLTQDVGASMPDPPGIELEDAAVTALYGHLWRMRAPSDWAPAELLLLVRVAKAEIALRREEEQLEREGHVIEIEFESGPRPALNPRIKAVEQLWRKHTGYLRVLNLQTRPTAASGIANRNAQFRTIEADHKRIGANATDVEDEPLIARPE